MMTFCINSRIVRRVHLSEPSSLLDVGLQRRLIIEAFVPEDESERT